MAIQTLNITKSGNGTGTVTSDVGIPLVDCGTTCTVTQTSGNNVTLTATPDPGSVFVRWTGDIPTTSMNPVTYEQTLNPTNINAEFAKKKKKNRGRFSTLISSEFCVNPNQYPNGRPKNLYVTGLPGITYTYSHTNANGLWCYRIMYNNAARNLVGLGSVDTGVYKK